MTEFCSIFQKEFEDFHNMRKSVLSKSAFAHDLHYLQSFDSFLSNNTGDTKSVTEQVVSGWLKTLKGKSSSIANEVIVIRIFLKYLQTSGITVYIPPIPKVSDDYIPYIFSDEEMNQIFRIADDIIMSRQQPNPYIQLEFPIIVRLLYGCGLRIGETLSLMVKDIDFDNGLLFMNHSKNDKQRIVPMHFSMAQLLRQYILAMGLLGKADMYLFPYDKSNKKMSVHAVRGMFSRILNRVGISIKDRVKHERGACLHCLRHVFVFKSFRKAESNGHSITDSIPYLSIYLGHNSLIETDKYLKFSSELFPEMLDLFDAYTGNLFPEVNYEE